MPRFDRPLALLILLIPPLVWLLDRLIARRRKPAFPMDAAIGPFSWAPDARARARTASAALWWAGFAMAALALAGPGSIERERVYMQRGRDILLAIDVSPSMAAAEGGSTRLESALGLARDLAGAGGNASLGLILFGSQSSLAVPPTEDRAYFLSALDNVRAGMLGPGTDLGLGLSAAFYHLASSEASSRLAILIADGEDNQGSLEPQEAAELFRRAGLPLLIVGIGSGGEVPLSYSDPESGRLYEGRLESPFDPRGLEELARAAGGQYIAAAQAGAMDRARAEALRAASPTGAFRETMSGTSLAPPLIAAALGLCALARLLALVLGDGP